MNPEDVRAEVRKRFGSMSELSRQHNLNPKAVSSAISRAGYSRRVEKIIARAINKRPQTIWPARYDPRTGQPLSFQARVQMKRSRAGV
ncbi:transcriptional regulator [Formicincola oecophyllae]|uniref:Transcriptional regulator n=1 Tax=Formicincola oecophyllae TaxID=2558361 RepID=A0A4Y6U9F4_9PROT|nr:helix-turn-helix domain-containing protein [Formicincola oecophyllae]QDH13834.1 transcriptional regulator [Formicincola oecophyllae]